MTPVAEKSQPLTALAKANDLLSRRANEKKHLRGRSKRDIARAVINPSDPLASFTIGGLFAPRSGSNGNTGIVSRFNRFYLNKAFGRLADRYPNGRHHWHSELRLRDLTEGERERLVDAIFEVAPRTSTVNSRPPNPNEGAAVAALRRSSP